MSNTDTTSNSSEELKQLYRKAWLNGLDGQKDMERWLLDAQALINREITKQKKLWWKKGWEDGRAEIEQARQQLLDELEPYAILEPIADFIQAKRSNLTKKGEE